MIVISATLGKYDSWQSAFSRPTTAVLAWYDKRITAERFVRIRAIFSTDYTFPWVYLTSAEKTPFGTRMTTQVGYPQTNVYTGDCQVGMQNRGIR